MKYAVSILALAMALVPVQGPAQDDLLARSSMVNKNLHTYTATMKAHVVMTTFPFLSADLGGTFYHKDPNHDKLEITSGLPAMAQQFSKLYPNFVPASQWSDVFNVEKLADDGKATHFKLTPKTPSNIASMEAVVDDKAATVTSVTWNYSNGGSAEMTNTYSNVKGYLLVTSQTGKVDEPQYKGTISSTISGYKLNPPIADSVFQEGQ